MALNFEIKAQEEISKAFLKRGVKHFSDAIIFVRSLDYKRNSGKHDLKLVFSENCGTCSTKHALLKQLCIENDVHTPKLIVGIFKMNAYNTPQVAATLQKFSLEYIPEAHCYLRVEDEIIDATKNGFEPMAYEADILEEVEIQPHQLAEFKEKYHKQYLQNWLLKHANVKLTLDEVWIIREQCIHDLSR